jgi:hypothetical protein
MPSIFDRDLLIRKGSQEAHLLHRLLPLQSLCRLLLELCLVVFFHAVNKSAGYVSHCLSTSG